MEKIFNWIDKTGRGEIGKMTFEQIREEEDREDWYDHVLHECAA